jgi:dihydropyrimidinase
MEVIYEGGVNQGRLSVNRFVEITSTTPARMFGMYPTKGTVAPGADADIVVFDPGKRHVISVDNQHMRVDYSAYEGMEVTGKVEKVLSRGRVIVNDGEYVGKPGDGQFLRRGTSQYLI